VEAEDKEAETPVSRPADLGPHGYAVVLMIIAALLVIAPEFFYLRDQFGYRINTIFKFYFQAWQMWGVAAAFGSAVLLSGFKKGWSVAFRLALAALLIIGMSYTYFGLRTKTNDFDRPAGLTLDAADHGYYLSPDEHLAVAWLLDAPLGALAEAVGGSFSQYGRISAHSGQPALLGWVGHESQWRGGGDEMGTRYADIERLYTTRLWEEAQAIIEGYGIRYIFVGPLETATYRVSQEKFDTYLEVVFQAGQVTIYAVP
jgi:uncharacterized membrane protein